jgi:O-antigen/teichoic acid export membrane protein
MSLAKSVATNISYVMFARAAFRFFTSLAMLYALRYFGPERYGMLETAIAWSNALMTITDLGLSTLVVREASRDESKASIFFGNTLVVQAVLSAFVLAVLVGIGYIFDYDSTQILLIALIGAAGLIFEFRKVMRSILRVFLELRFISIVEVVNGAIFLSAILSVFLFWNNQDAALLAFAWIQLIVNVLTVILLFWYTRRYASPHINLSAIPSMVKESWIFMLYGVFFMLYFQTDQILLSILMDKHAVGIYSAPAKLAAVLLFIPAIIYQVVLPLLFRYYESDFPRYQRLISLSFRYFAAFGIAAGIGLILVADEFVPFVMGEEYRESIPIMKWMGAFVAVRFLTLSLSDLLTTANKQNTLAAIQIAAVCLNVILDLILIPRYGALGPAIATLIVESLSFSIYVWFTRPIIRIPIHQFAIPLFKIAVSASVMTVVVLLTRGSAHTMVVILFGAAAYAITLLSVRFITSEDARLIRTIIAKKS